MKFLYSVCTRVGSFGLIAALSFSAKANLITVQEVGVSPVNPIITCTGAGGPNQVYAGVSQIVADGTPMYGFCLNPYQLSLSSSSSYSYVPLTSAQKGYGASPNNTIEIERLWANFYPAATTSAATAAGLQIAIWELAGGSGFQLDSSNDYGATGMLGLVQSANYAGPTADLVALEGRGQDYVVENSSPSSVPDGGNTGLLLGGVLCALAVFGAKPVRSMVTAMVRGHAGCFKIGRGLPQH